MAKIRGSTTTVVRSGATSIIVDHPPGYQTGDLLFVFVTKDDAVGGSFTSTAGWTAGTEGSIGSGVNSIRSNYYYKIAASTSEPNLRITSTDNDTWSAVSLAIYGHDAVTPIDVASAPTAALTGNPYVAPSVTTTTNNALLLRLIGSDGSVAQMPEPGFVLEQVIDGSAEAVCVAYDVQVVAGATPTCDFYAQTTADESLLYTVAIRDGSSGAILPGHPNADCATLIRGFNGNSIPITGDAIDTNADNFSQLAGAWQNPSLVYQVDDSPLTFTDITTAATNATDADVAPFPTTEANNDYLAIGFTSQPRSIRFDRAGCTQGVGGNTTKEYLSSSGTWEPLPDFFDGPNNFNAALADHQICGWTPPTDWTAKTLNGQSYFWIRFRVTTVYTTNPTISQIFVSTSIALQHFTLTGRTNAGFLPQYDSLNLGLTQGGNSMYGGAYLTAAAINLSTAKILGTFLYDSPADQLDLGNRDEGGVSFGLLDSTHKVKAWAVGARNSLDSSPNRRNCYLIQTNQSTDTSFISNSPTLTDVRRFLLMNNAKFSQPQLSHSAIINVGTLKINGGGATAPVDFNELVKVANGFPAPMIDSIANIAYIPIQIGGDRAVNLQMSGFTIGFPTQATEANKRTAFHCDHNVAGFIIDARAGDTCKMQSGKIYGGSPFLFTVTATASASATYGFSGLVLENATVTLRPVFNFASMSFNSCPSFTQNGATTTSCSFNNTKITATTLNTIINCAFTSGGTGHAIEITTPGTYTFDRNTFTGYGANGTTDAAIFNNSGGHVEINLQNYTDQIPTVRNGAGATTTVVPLPSNATVSGIISGSRIWVKNLTTNSVIANEIVSGTLWSLAYQNGDAFSNGDAVSVRLTESNGVNASLEFSAGAIAGPNGWSLLAAQVPNTIYGLLGEDGSTALGFSADYVSDEVDITIAANFHLAKLYAWWIYNLTTEQGIDEFFGGITALDEVTFINNTSIVAIRLDNLTTTNIYALDNRRFMRSDGARPVRQPTTGGGGIDVEWRERVLLANSVAINAQLAAIAAKTNNLPATPANEATVVAVGNAVATHDTNLNGKYTTLISEHDATQSAIAALSVPSAAAVADAVWDEVLTGATHNIATSAGRRLRQLGTTLAADGDLIGTPTATVLQTNLTQTTNDFYKDQTLRITSGALTGQAVPILSYNGTTKTITLSEALTSAPSASDTFEIDANHIHSIAQIQSGLAVQSDLAAVKAKTDALVINSGLVDVNVEKMNGADVIGTGTTGDSWRGVGVSP